MIEYLYTGNVNEKVLRGLSIALGLTFVSIAVFIRLTHELAPGESYLILLYPLSTGLAMLLAGLRLSAAQLRWFYVVWYAGLPAVFWVTSTIGCKLAWFSAAWCR